MPVSITKDNFDAEITRSQLPVILDVYAEWCGPCLQMAPIFEELEKEYGSKYKFAKLNVDEVREIAITYGVTSIPTFVFIKNNEVVSKETGYMTKDVLADKLKEFFG